MRKTLFIGVTLVVLATFAAAQIPTSGNVFIGYSYYNTKLTVDRGSLNGWEGSLEGKIFPFIGIVADFSGHYGSMTFPVACPVNVIPCGPINANVHMENFLFGPRVSVSVGKFRPFGEALFGAGHVNTNGFGSDTSFATGLGGGLDYTIIRPIAWRFQGDYIHTKLFSVTQNNARISTGIVLRF